jgi:hypothetical protein
VCVESRVAAVWAGSRAPEWVPRTRTRCIATVIVAQSDRRAGPAPSRQIVDLEGVHATLSGLEPGAGDDGGAPGGVGAANGTPVRWTVTRPWIIKSRPSWGKLVSGELSMLTTFDDVAAWSLDVLDDESTVGRYVFPGYA